MRKPRFHRRFDYDRSLLPNAHLASLETEVSDVDAAREKTGASIGYPGWSVIHSLLLSSLHPERSHTLIETGTNFGSTTIVMAQALKDAGVQGQLHTFEIDPDVQEQARRNVSAAGLADRVVFHLGDSRKTLPAMLEAHAGKISGAFLDGAHEQDVAIAEFETLKDRLARGALVLFDNTYPITEPEKGEDPRVNGALSLLLEKHGGALINLPFVSWFTPGLAIWQAAPPLDAEDWDA